MEQDTDIDLERMSDVDNLMWIVERNPLLRSTMTAVTMLDEAPNRQVFEEKFTQVTMAIPRLRQRVVANPVSIAPPRWEVDPDFEQDNHVRWVDLEAPHNSIDHVIALAEDIAGTPFDRTRPLWEFALVAGLETGQAAFISKLHHSIADGMGSIQLMLEIFDLEQAPGPKAAPPEITANPKSQVERVKNAILHERDRQADAMRQTLEVVRSLPESPTDRVRLVADTAASLSRAIAPSTSPLSPLMANRSSDSDFRTLEIPLDELKAAGKAAGCKLNAAFVAGIIGALRSYHDLHATPVETLRMGMPISTRTDDDSATSNSFAATRIEVPMTIDDPLELMVRIDELVVEARHDPAIALTSAAAGVMSRLPKRALTGLFEKAMKGIDFSASNVPGVPIPVFLTGVPVTGQFPFGPLSGSAVNITLLSYLDTAYIGVNIDQAAIPDGDVFHSELSTSFGAILDLA